MSISNVDSFIRNHETARFQKLKTWSHDKAHGFLSSKGLSFTILHHLLGVVFYGVDFCLLGIYIIAAMEVVCTETAGNKSLVYSETKAALQPLTGRANLQGHEMCRFEQAHVEFPSCWDLNATVVESKIEKELSNAYQTNAIQMPNNLYEITSAKYQMLNNCETHDLSNEESLKHENTKEQNESVTVPERHIDPCIRKHEFQNGILLQTSSKFKV